MYRPIEPANADFKTDFYYGTPQETFYSRNVEQRTPYRNVRHLAEAGQLIQVFGDFEASDKDRETAAPKDGGFLAFDLQGRLLSRLALPIAIPQHVAYSVGAALVGRVRPSDLDKGWTPFMAATMVRDFYAGASRLNGKALGLEDTAFKDGKVGFPYLLDFPDEGPVKLEIDKHGKKFRFEGENAWRKVYGAWHPFNGENYDDFLASHWFASQGSAHLFLSSRKFHNFVRTDARKLAMWVWAFGPQDKQGLQLPVRWHKKTGREVLSTKLGDIVRANSPPANRARGVSGGIRYYDGREFDPDKMHGSLEDAAATAGLYFYMRQKFPEELRWVERMSDEQSQKNLLQGNKAFGDRPLVGFFHYDEGMLERGIGMLLSTGDTYGQKSRSEVLLFNLSAYDPQEVFRRSENDLRALIVQRHNPLVVRHRVNQTPIFADFERAYEAGAGNHLSPDEYQKRRMALLNNQAGILKIMEIHSDLTNPSRPPNITTPRRLEEDSYSHYGDLEYIPLKDPVTGKKIDEPKDIYMRRSHKWKRERDIDEAISLGTQGHATDYSDDPAAVIERLELHKKTRNKLEKTTGHWKHSVVLRFGPSASDMIHDLRINDWHMRFEANDMRFSNTPDCWVVNQRGQRLPWDKIVAMPYEVRRHQWPKRGEDNTDEPHLRIEFQRNPNRYPIIGALVAFDADRYYKKYAEPEFLEKWNKFFKKYWEPSRAWHDAYVTYTVQGPPNLDPSQHPVMTDAKRLIEIERLEKEAGAGPNSEYAQRVLSTPMGPQMLAEWKDYTVRRLQEYQWTPERMSMMGFDPVTKYPYPNPAFWVERDKTIQLKVPDSMLENPGWHDQWHSHLVLAQPDARLRAELNNLPKSGKSLLLTGHATGMFRLAAQAVCSPLPNSVDGSEAIKRAESGYATIGGNLGEKPFLLTFQQLAPVHRERYVDESIQHVTISSLDWAGLVDARAGSLPPPLKPLEGLIVRDVGQEFKAGPIRLRRLQAGRETGDEFQGALASASRITTEDLAIFSDEDARRFGKPNAADLYSQWRKIFADLSTRDPQSQTLWALRLAEPVDKRSYTYFKRDEMPAACFLPERPVSISQNSSGLTGLKEVA